jgi:predicted metal-binding protein
MDIPDLKPRLDRAGVTQHGFVDTADVSFLEEIRAYCEENACRQYGTNWCCPPAVGTVQECKERVQAFGRMLVFTTVYEMEDAYDFEAMMSGMRDFKARGRAVDDELGELLGPHITLSNEGCGICKACTYPDAPCRFPEKAHHSIEGYGILISELSRLAGVAYNNGPGTVTYFGAVCHNG